MAGVQKISNDMVAIKEADYRVLYAAASDSYSHWEQAQTYKRELTEARTKLAEVALPNETIRILRVLLAESRRANRRLLGLLGVASIAGIILGVCR